MTAKVNEFTGIFLPWISGENAGELLLVSASLSRNSGLEQRADNV